MDLVTRVRVSAVLGSTLDLLGTSRTSSKVSASRISISSLLGRDRLALPYYTGRSEWKGGIGRAGLTSHPAAATCRGWTSAPCSLSSPPTPLAAFPKMTAPTQNARPPAWNGSQYPPCLPNLAKNTAPAVLAVLDRLRVRLLHGRAANGPDFLARGTDAVAMLADRIEAVGLIKADRTDASILFVHGIAANPAQPIPHFLANLSGLFIGFRQLVFVGPDTPAADHVKFHCVPPICTVTGVGYCPKSTNLGGGDRAEPRG